MLTRFVVGSSNQARQMILVSQTIVRNASNQFSTTTAADSQDNTATWSASSTLPPARIRSSNSQAPAVKDRYSSSLDVIPSVQEELGKLKPCRALFYPEQMEWLDERQVRISRPTKNVMQSGTANTQTWTIEFNSQQRWENWLMGWTSSADPMSNLSLNFPTKEDAIAFCDKNKLQWFVDEKPERKIRKKSYADNFSWNKRTRLGNK